MDKGRERSPLSWASEDDGLDGEVALVVTSIGQIWVHSELSKQDCPKVAGERRERESGRWSQGQPEHLSG